MNEKKAEKRHHRVTHPSFEPVPGWTAEKTVIETNGAACRDSYRVIRCPEYAPDPAFR